MRRLRFRICVAGCIALVLLPSSRSAADTGSYCPGCKAGIIGAAIGIGALVGVGIYLVHRHHTSLTGCVQQTGNGLNLTAKDGTNYALVNAPTQVTEHKRFSLRGHKANSPSGHVFRVDHVSRDYGACPVQ